MKRLAIIAALACLGCIYAQAPKPQATFDAQQILRRSMGFRLNGSAEITINGLVIRADEIDLDETTGKITVTGNPTITPVSTTPFPIDFRNARARQ